MKYIAFGKVRIGSKSENQCEQGGESDKTKDYKAKELFEEQAKKANDDIEEIRNLKSSKVGRIW